MTERRVPKRLVITLVWSVVVWTALWGEVSVANALGGLVVGALTLWLVPVRWQPERVRIRPMAALRFLGFFAWGLLRASAVVAWEVVTPSNRIHQAIVEVPVHTTTPGVVTLIANAISLIPGTLTLEVRRDPPTLYVHVLHLQTIEETRAELGDLVDRAVNAFPDAEPASDDEVEAPS
ncbi:MAG: Na+/H+ antiporter subunit E [Actinobacteria bacterium]|nr:Na+/H+ antiporter subunit E [Actinomycetota bacterium]